MAIIKSSLKRAKTNEKKRIHNTAIKSDMRTAMKKVEALAAAGEMENAKTAYNSAVSKLDKAARKGLIHKNNASRQKSRLAKLIQG